MHRIVLIFFSSLIASASGLYPDPGFTPGRIDPGATKAKICTSSGYTASVRSVSGAARRAVFDRYKVRTDFGKYEVDHFVSLELGGSNALENLWPEAYEPKPGAREKDVVETYLHRQICAGKLSLKAGQEAIKRDWYAVYCKIKGLICKK